jgi:hypothetical protein
VSEPVHVIEISDPPTGFTWKFARVGQELADTPEGKNLIQRMENQDIYVEILEGGGYEFLTQPFIPKDAQIRRTFKPKAT